MKKFVLSLLTLCLLVSCIDDDGIKDYTAENEAEIQQYLTDNELDDLVVKDENGIYYIIEEEGTGTAPASGDIVSFKYHGYLTDGEEVVTSDDELSFLVLDNINLYGLRIGLEYFSPGSIGKIILPSSLAYGEGSVVIFDIEMDNVYSDIDSANEAEIQNYLTVNNLTESAVRTDSGLYYIIEEEGTGENPTSTDNVTVAYKGYYTSGTTVFDESTTGVAFDLEGVIEGWTEGIPYFKVGGSGKLIIPSSLGYQDGVVRVFDVELKSIN